MHEAHKATAKQGHVDVMQLDKGANDLHERELRLTMYGAAPAKVSGIAYITYGAGQ